MQIGVTFPQTELGGDPDTVRTYATTVEEYGYRHILAYDHVLGADPSAHQGWSGPYDVDTTFHEPLVLFGFLAAITTLELVTGIVILPQRPTALVAKQAAEVDLLCNGRLRLGVGLGWNAVEYEALGQDFSTRGRRLEEQVPLLRRLWTERSVTHHGKFEHISGAGIAPLPVQRPIPVWFGAASTPAFERVGRLADGWFPMFGPGARFEAARAVVEESAGRAGRDPATIGMETRVNWVHGASEVAEQIAQWREAGASHVSVNTMGAGLTSVGQHLDALERVAQLVTP
ncbi:MAG TPA: LLM class F420-dependent oxidoreductase [Acidimicrobiales bacterium]|nr:LLM class F420-dependent oxidoreductase [Acidimicrobiales bacterium]